MLGHAARAVSVVYTFAVVALVLSHSLVSVPEELLRLGADYAASICTATSSHRIQPA